MKTGHLISGVLLCFVAAAWAGEPRDPGCAAALPVASRASLEDHSARAHIFADPDWFQWGGSVVQGEDGKHHMFYARWRRDNRRGMRGWLYECEIAHATSEQPEGPYRHVETVLRGFGQPQVERWDAINAHNPCITRMTNPETGKPRYYLYYIGTRDDNSFENNDWWDHIINQRIGVAWSDCLEGPWVRHDKPVITPPNGPLRHYLVNPAVCELPDGRFLMVLKGRDDGKGHGRMIHGWALANRPEGPFVAQDSLLFPATVSAEDPCVWADGNWIFAVVKDWHGNLSGTPGISYVRGQLDGDTIRWEIPDNNSISPRILFWKDGKQTRLHSLERPFVLRNAAGRPTHLFAAASVETPFANAHGKASPHLPFNVCLPLKATDKK